MKKYDEILKMSEEIAKLRELIHFMRFKPHEWITQDRQFRSAFISKIREEIADQVNQLFLLDIYRDRPQKVAEIVKKVVEDYLKIWEVNDQIAQQIVVNSISKPEIKEELVKMMLPMVMRAVSNIIADRSKILEAAKLLRDYDVLEKESRS
jgi:hypothetical protein